MQWDLFCRVIDNHGDIGVCWRIARGLTTRGERVRLWVDDASALAWMAPDGAPGVTVLPWPEVDIGVELGDVVIEAFGCELPTAFLHRMAGARQPPRWINLEYLSAEPFAERAHKLASPPTRGAAQGLRKWFFYPGFTPRTGGLLREPDLFQRQHDFDARAWLNAADATPATGERVVSLFCYEPSAVAALLDRLALQPTLLLATTGHAARQVRALLGPTLRRGLLRARVLPALTQQDFDHLLWASDLNFVRGEDSFVRAQWAAKPFVWQIYPQSDGVHLVKLDAFLTRFLAHADADLAHGVRRVWHAWNQESIDPVLPDLADASAWQRHCELWRTERRLQPDLVSQLLEFVCETG